MNFFFLSKGIGIYFGAYLSDHGLGTQIQATPSFMFQYGSFIVSENKGSPKSVLKSKSSVMAVPLFRVTPSLCEDGWRGEYGYDV